MEEALITRLRQLLAEDSSLGFRSLHAKLKEEPGFQDVALKKVQTALQQLKSAASLAAEAASAGPGENIWTAASDGDVARVDALMALEGFTPSSQDKNGYTPVMAAASWGHVDLLSLLLKRQPESVSLGDADGDTALHHVAQATELEAEQVRPVVQLLLEAKADASARNAEGKTCLDCCASGAMVEGEEDQEPEINLMFLKIMEEMGFKA